MGTQKKDNRHISRFSISGILPPVLECTFLIGAGTHSGAGLVVELSLRWCVSYDYVSSVIIGVSRMEHLEQNLSYLERGALEEEVLEKCDDVWQMLNGNRFSYYH